VYAEQTARISGSSRAKLTRAWGNDFEGPIQQVGIQTARAVNFGIAAQAEDVVVFDLPEKVFGLDIGHAESGGRLRGGVDVRHAVGNRARLSRARPSRPPVCVARRVAKGTRGRVGRGLVDRLRAGQLTGAQHVCSTLALENDLHTGNGSRADILCCSGRAAIIGGRPQRLPPGPAAKPRIRSPGQNQANSGRARSRPARLTGPPRVPIIRSRPRLTPLSCGPVFGFNSERFEGDNRTWLASSVNSPTKLSPRSAPGDHPSVGRFLGAPGAVRAD